MRVQVLGHTLENAVSAPGPHTLRVVLCSLEHLRTGQLGQIGGRADVVGMEMRDHEALDRTLHPLEDRSPASRALPGSPRPASTAVHPSEPGSK